MPTHPKSPSMTTTQEREFRRGVPLIVAILSLLATAMTSVSAEVISDNLLATPDSGVQLDSTHGSSQQFTTTSTAYQITQVSVPLFLNSGAASPTGGTIDFYIYDSVAGIGGGENPGTTSISLGSFAASNITFNTFPFTGQTVTLSGLSVVLSPNTKYFLAAFANGVTAASGSEPFVFWGNTSSTSQLGFPSYNSEFVSDGFVPGFQPGALTTPNRMQITAVPEPSTYAMALAGLACGGFATWRRRKRA